MDRADGAGRTPDCPWVPKGLQWSDRSPSGECAQLPGELHLHQIETPAGELRLRQIEKPAGELHLRHIETPADSAIALIDFKCERTVGSISLANALASESRPELISCLNSTMVFWCALIWLLM